ncbi:MAG TPA: DUF222 domain-containing protein [Myxococcota bacterium]|nr:DUF222 domain-containing protein [Myxococcota bacterium]
MSNTTILAPRSAASPEPSTLSNAELELAIATHSAEIDAAEHRLLTLIRHFDERQRHRDHGLPSAAAWLSWRVGLGPVAAREKVRVAKALASLPQIDAAFARAEVSYSKVRAMTRIATPESEGRLLHMAKNASAAQLETICRGVAQVMERSEYGASRWLTFRPDTDGMVRLEVRLGADDAALLKRALEAAREGDSAEAPTGEERVSALVRLADAFIAEDPPDGRPGADRHQLVVVMKAEVASPEGMVAMVANDGPMGALAQRCVERLACDATLVDADTGRKQRVVSPPLRRALQVRDGGCRFPGCTNRRWVDAHHIIPWSHGGPTTKANLLLLCTTHHRFVHELGYTIEGDGDSPTFKRPSGSLIDRSPLTIPRNRLPMASPARAPDSGRPNYHWAIGAGLPRPRGTWSPGPPCC